MGTRVLVERPTCRCDAQESHYERTRQQLTQPFFVTIHRGGNIRATTSRFFQAHLPDGMLQVVSATTVGMLYMQPEQGTKLASCLQRLNICSINTAGLEILALLIIWGSTIESIMIGNGTALAGPDRQACECGNAGTPCASCTVFLHVPFWDKRGGQAQPARSQPNGPQSTV